MNEIARSWPAEAETLLDDLVDLRRAIHREPELGLQNPKTLAKIKDALAGLPLEFREGPSTTGLIAILRGPANGRTVLLRGDMGGPVGRGACRERGGTMVWISGAGVSLKKKK